MSSSSYLRRRAIAAPIVFVTVIGVAGCDGDDADSPATNPSGGSSIATSVSTSSLPPPNFTAAPNPDAGGAGAPSPTSEP